MGVVPGEASSVSARRSPLLRGCILGGCLVDVSIAMTCCGNVAVQTSISSMPAHVVGQHTLGDTHQSSDTSTTPTPPHQPLATHPTPLNTPHHTHHCRIASHRPLPRLLLRLAVDVVRLASALVEKLLPPVGQWDPDARAKPLHEPSAREVAPDEDNLVHGGLAIAPSLGGWAKADGFVNALKYKLGLFLALVG